MTLPERQPDAIIKWVGENFVVTTRLGWSEQFLSSYNGCGVGESDDDISLQSELNANKRKP